ncbi:hypothetical protein DGG96_13885 [Legionella qingyii]|uniref:Uncharacterized protein n=1 Tax=Legionella qingyii TaxID=2184757 RepID=A0A317U3S4_9GAMM|nr:hypothetical protein [Legionella qingyii]PWY55000.1 hypothetical protein DGG96_13885 [Legionella qingyii]RUR26395.1 hypothetical protein ELY20_00275 [Legionella qingyii]RUR27416.1 hypothetical protein ELY16_04620 [Legionella qingyii]
MGKKNKQSTSFAGKNNFDIPPGLVAQRRAQLIAAREQSRLTSVTFIDPDTNNTHTKPLSHLTKSRPQIKHKNPSRTRRKLNASSHDFLKKNEQITGCATDINLTVDWLKELKNTISGAWIAYSNYYKLGINTRQPNGWFSWWRHTEDGQIRAEKINNEAEASDNTDIIMKQMEQFFEDPSTRYENHSFATYLFEQFNRLLERHEYKPRQGIIYDKNYWHTIAEQLHRLMAKEAYNHSSETPVL